MTKQQIGQNFKRLRLSRKWTLDEAAERLGYAGGAAIHNLETGRRLPPVERLPDIAAAFGLEVWQLAEQLFR